MGAGHGKVEPWELLPLNFSMCIAHWGHFRPWEQQAEKCVYEQDEHTESDTATDCVYETVTAR